MHARTLSSRLRQIIIVAATTPAAMSCGGVVDTSDGGDDAANPSDGSSPIDTGMPGCSATWIDAGSICGSKEVQLSGDCHVTNDAGAVPTATCQAICGAQQMFCTYNPSTSVFMCGGVCVGRLPKGVDVDATPSRGIADYLARAAYLESASVDAFQILAHELRTHGAPTSLRRAAERAADDEVRHARTMRDLAAAFGADVESPVVSRSEVRPMLEIALENAVEGCVRETFGALVALWQAEHARDERVRTAMAEIAEDEVRHAALGWRLLAWTHDMLSPAEREQVQGAMQRAARELEAGARGEPDGAMAVALGLPSASHATALVQAMRRELWS